MTPFGPPKFVEINATAAGDNTILAGIASTKIRVIDVVYVCDAAVTVSWKSGATVKIQPMAHDQYGGLSFQGNLDNFWVEGGVNEDLILTLGGAVNVRGRILYHEVA